MDEGIIKIIIAVVFFAIAAIVERAKKAKDASRLPDEKAVRPQASAQGQKPKEAMHRHATAKACQSGRPLQRVPLTQNANRPSIKPAPQAARLPEEGVRVTSKPMQPIAAERKCKVFKSRDDLRRAIILGEILAPKF